ncbi:MAG: cyclodeaminase/cyclohydrolase family protein [Desulfobacterales bacterium]|nr:cyclodeaminase/cyclohydrolase family protein [Desulfobacterales bacterium]
MTYKDTSISDFLNMLARDVPPLPAGGCAAALCGASSSSLGIMMARIMIRRSKAAGDKKALEYILKDLLVFQKTFLNLMDEDQAAYERVMDALGKKKNSIKPDSDYDGSLNEAFIISLKPPMALIETSIRMLRLFELLAAKIHEPLKADLTVAVESACACFKGSLMIAGENLKKIRNPETVASLIKQLDQYESEVESIKHKLNQYKLEDNI